MTIRDLLDPTKKMSTEELNAILDRITEKSNKVSVLQAIKSNPDWIEALPQEVKDKLKGEKGDRGEQGPQGLQGPSGRDGRDGRNGLDGRNGVDGRNGKDGINGKDGKDGVSIIDASIAADGSLVVTLSNGNEIDCGKVLGEGILNQYYSLASSTGSGLINLTETLIETAPNNVVPVVDLEVNNSTFADVDLVIAPKGTGALLTQVPDNATTGGNKRGARAVDLQTIRTNAIQVASGATSVVSGGRENRASGSSSVVCGGLANTASGPESVVIGGAANQATGSQSVSGGGNSNIASGLQTLVLGGIGNTASGDLSIALGSRANTNSIRGQVAFGHVSDASGRYQTCLTGLRQQTTGTTATRATSNAAAAGTVNQLILRNNSADYFEGKVVALDITTLDAKEWRFNGLIKRGANAGTTALVGTPTVTSSFADTNAASWTLALSADTTNGGLAVTVTGAGANSIRWNVEIISVEVTV